MLEYWNIGMTGTIIPAYNYNSMPMSSHAAMEHTRKRKSYLDMICADIRKMALLVLYGVLLLGNAL